MIDENININYEKDNKKTFNKKLLISIIIITLLVLITIILIKSFSIKEPDIKGNYTLKFDDNIILYMNENGVIPIELNGPEEYTKEATTGIVLDSEDIISIKIDEFEGKSGLITATPISVGDIDIDIYSTIGADKYSRLLTNNTMHVIVCETFDNNILNSKKIQINQGKTQKINLNFKNPNCLKNIIYKSENTNIATVDNNGIITAIKKGTTNIKIGNSNKLITLEISVI